MTDRLISTPGEAPAERKKPGPKPKIPVDALAASTPAADLAEFESDDLPPVEQFTPAQQALIARMVADAVRASRSSQDPGTAAKLAAAANSKASLPTQDAAKATCDAAVAAGRRPRPILTADGWYAHPELARTKDHGVAKLGNEG